MAKVRIRCPHCEGEIRMDLRTEAVGTPRKGPMPTNLDPEIEKFILEAIEVYKCSFRAVGELLEEKGIHTPNGHRVWYASSVRREYEKAVKRRKILASNT